MKSDLQILKNKVIVTKRETWRGRINQKLGMNIYTLLYINNQKGPTAQETTLNILGQLIWQKKVKENEYMDMYNSVILLYTWN